MRAVAEIKFKRHRIKVFLVQTDLMSESAPEQIQNSTNVFSRHVTGSVSVAKMFLLRNLSFSGAKRDDKMRKNGSKSPHFMSQGKTA